VTVQDAEGKTSTVDVTVGETSGNLTEITSGLAEGDEVVLVVFTPGGGNDQRGNGKQTGEFPGGGQFLPGGPQGGTGPQFNQQGGGQTNG